MADEARVTLEQDGGVLTVTLNRPHRLNALDLATLNELDHAIARARADSSVRAVLLTGAGRAFCAGADVKEWAGEGGEPDAAAEPADDWVTTAHRVIATLYRLPKPVVAAVNGVAVGAGLDLALAADFRVASDTARFGSVYITLGIPPDAGASYLLPRIVGVPKAKELIYTGRIIDAAEADRIGLLTQLVPAADLMTSARAWAGQLASGPTIAIGMAKENIHEHWTSSIEAALKNEQRAGQICTSTADHREGLAAVNAKRPAQFAGR
jgi:enoyl-CoA hydratase/carnithine racemase